MPPSAHDPLRLCWAFFLNEWKKKRILSQMRLSSFLTKFKKNPDFMSMRMRSSSLSRTTSLDTNALRRQALLEAFIYTRQDIIYQTKPRFHAVPPCHTVLIRPDDLSACFTILFCYWHGWDTKALTVSWRAIIKSDDLFLYKKFSHYSYSRLCVISK